MNKLFLLLAVITLSACNPRGTVIMRIGDDGTVAVDAMSNTDLFVFGMDSTMRNTGTKFSIVDSKVKGNILYKNEFHKCPTCYECPFHNFWYPLVDPRMPMILDNIGTYPLNYFQDTSRVKIKVYDDDQP